MSDCVNINEVFNMIDKNPGLTINELAAAFNLDLSPSSRKTSLASISVKVKRLIRHNFVVSKGKNGKRRFYKNV